MLADLSRHTNTRMGIYSPFHCVYRFFLTLHKHSSIADLLKVVCGKLCTDYSYAADPDSLVAGTVRNMQLKEVLVS